MSTCHHLPYQLSSPSHHHLVLNLLHQPPNQSPLLFLFHLFWKKQLAWQYKDIHYGMFLHCSKISKSISPQWAQNPKSLHSLKDLNDLVPVTSLMTTLSLAYSTAATLSSFLFIRDPKDSPAFHLGGLEYLSPGIHIPCPIVPFSSLL